MLDLARRVVMISGANRGIGLAIATRLRAAGARLSLGARDLDALASATDGWDDDLLLRHHYDATRSGTDAQWVEATVDRWGGIDVLVNNAGISDRISLDSGDDEILDRLYATNIKGPFRMIRLALPHLRAADHGRIVNLSSLSGIRVVNDNAGYAMSKFAVTALSHAARRAGWEDGVRVVNLCPGFVATDMAATHDLDMSEVVQPEDLAELVATVVALPDTASVAQLTVGHRWEPTV